jgi:S-adenosylmethionine:tRNA ribosyltransferase-isomerase
MPAHPKQLRIKDFTYRLPDEQIAKYPLADRSASKLLYYNQGNIQDEAFASLPDLLPPDSLLIFNNTKVVQARLIFRRPTGSIIEVFCLEPVAPTTEMQAAMQQAQSCTWKCLVGNAKRWKEDILQLVIANGNESVGHLNAQKGERLEDSFLVHFSWEPRELTFAEILEKAGNLPLPPYLNRAATKADKQHYQTVYAQNEGAVAAPTAGLHFTDKIIAALRSRNNKLLEVTLHVGAGTFKPVKAEEMADHPMHSEEIYVSGPVIRQLQQHLPRPVIPVGTTSLRTIESLYWLGVRLIREPEIKPDNLQVPQWLPYQISPEITAAEALNALQNYLLKNNLDHIRANTQLLIAPGYSFKITTGLITNFHQPESTLLLLVAALIGEDWKKVYNHALQNQYRFLSYGDSSLLQL